VFWTWCCYKTINTDLEYYYQKSLNLVERFRDKWQMNATRLSTSSESDQNAVHLIRRRLILSADHSSHAPMIFLHESTDSMLNTSNKNFTEQWSTFLDDSFFIIFRFSLGENLAVTLFGVPDFAWALLPMLKVVLRHILLLVQISGSYTFAPGWFRQFSQKKRLNACGFAREFLQSGMLYRPSNSLKRRGKSSSLHSKKNFYLGGAGFLWVTS